MHTIKIVCLAILCGILTPSASAQLDISKVDEHGYILPSYGDVQTEKTEKAAYYFRHHKPLAATYSGYLIELSYSSIPLRRDNQLFKHFGNVFYHKFTSGGYSYGIKLNFEDKKEMKRYLDQVVLPVAPKARIIKYKKGVRKTS